MKGYRKTAKLFSSPVEASVLLSANAAASRQQHAGERPLTFADPPYSGSEQATRVTDVANAH